MKNRIGICADGYVGSKTVAFLFEHYPDDIQWVICNNEQSQILSSLKKNNFDTTKVFFYNQLTEESVLNQLINSRVNYILLAWWPHIIKEPLLSTPKIGVLNFHPSMLPYNRGKHYNFWTIVEDTPFGVSIHFVDETVDSGDVIFQKEIIKSWLDTGETLYNRAQEAMLELFIEKYSEIRKGNYNRKQQNLTLGTFHLARELDQASKILLDKTYNAKELINIIRARTFVPNPAAWFEQDGVRYEIRIKINKI